MIASKPIRVLDDQGLLLSSNVPATEPDANDWDNATTYNTGDRVIFGIYKYESLIDGNLNIQPDVGAAAEPPSWRNLGPINRWRMFDLNPARFTSRAGVIDVTISVTGNIVGVVGVINSLCSSVTIRILDAGDNVIEERSQSAFASAEVDPKCPVSDIVRSDFVFSDLDLELASKVRVLIYAQGGTASVGCLLVGPQTELGCATRETVVESRDYSRFEVDEFGDFDIFKRRYAKQIDFRAFVDGRDLARVQTHLSRFRSQPILFVGDSSSEVSIVYGFVRSFQSDVFVAGEYSFTVLGMAYEDPEIVTTGIFLAAPSILIPESGDPNFPANGLVQASAFTIQPANADTHAVSDWQIASDETFDTIVHESLDDATNLTEYPIPAATLTPSTAYYVRVRYGATIVGDSAWSAPVLFTAGPEGSVDTPTITSPTASQTLDYPITVTSSAFALTGAPTETHFASDWQFATDVGFTAIAHEGSTLAGTLTEYVVPVGALDPDTTYYVRVRHRSRRLAPSAYSAGVEFTTAVPCDESLYTTPGTHSFVVPDGVASVAAVLVGAGSAGRTGNGEIVGSGAGGGLRWINALSVTPGETLTVVVPPSRSPVAPGVPDNSGGDAILRRGNDVIVFAQGGRASVTNAGAAVAGVIAQGGAGSTIGGNIGGGDGGSTFDTQIGPGAGAGGYSGNGGSPGGDPATGGAGGWSFDTDGGGGVGLFGEGDTGGSGVIGAGNTGGSGGGSPNSTSSIIGGLYGGGGGGDGTALRGGASGQGAVRIIWGLGRSFPASNTGSGACGMPWTPDELGDLGAWHVADNGDNTLVSGQLDTIADKSGNGYDASPYLGSSANRAAIIPAALNSRDVWRAASASPQGIFNLSGGALNLTQNVGGFTLAAVWRDNPAQGAASVNIYRYNNGSDTLSRAMIGTGSYGSNTVYAGGRRLDADAFNGAHDPSDTGGQWKIIVGVLDYTGALATLTVNGEVFSLSPFQTAGNTSNTPSTSIGIGHNGAGLGISTGDFAELVAVQSAVSAADRQRIEGYLADQWGLSASLPMDHPYRNGRPTL